MTNTKVEAPSKAQLALAIFTEESTKGEEKLRARVIARFVEELGMGKAGASTYFQNAKTTAAGNKVKHYYTPKTTKPKADESTDDSKEDAILFNVKNADGSVGSFTTLKSAEESIAKSGGELITEEEEAAAILGE